MTNFQFSQSEYKPLFEQTKGAEQLVHFDPRVCVASVESYGGRNAAQQVQPCYLSSCRARGEGAQRAGEGRSSARIVAACPTSGAARHLLPAARGEGMSHRCGECDASPAWLATKTIDTLAFNMAQTA